MSSRSDRPGALGDRGGTDPELERALGELPLPAARPEFRARLREQFLEVATAEPAAPAVPVAIGRADRTRLLPFFLPALIAAAVMLVVWSVLTRETPRRWTVLEGAAEGLVVIDGVQVESTNRTRLSDLLATAGEIETKDAPLRIQLERDLVIDLGPRSKLTKMTFPAAGYWSVRAESGSARICTGPTFSADKHLRVFTADMELGVTGTIFAVDVEPKGTCVCCLQGRIDATPKGTTAAKPIEAGKMCYAYHDTKPAVWGPAVEQHLPPLRDLKGWSDAHWKK